MQKQWFYISMLLSSIGLFPALALAFLHSAQLIKSTCVKSVIFCLYKCYDHMFNQSNLGRGLWMTMVLMVVLKSFLYFVLFDLQCHQGGHCRDKVRFYFYALLFNLDFKMLELYMIVFRVWIRVSASTSWAKVPEGRWHIDKQQRCRGLRRSGFPLSSWIINSLTPFTLQCTTFYCRGHVRTSDVASHVILGGFNYFELTF